MDRDEVIDTSDPEEYAQELEERRKKKLMATTQSSIYGFDVHYSDHGPFPPKKKTKVCSNIYLEVGCVINLFSSIITTTMTKRNHH